MSQSRLASKLDVFAAFVDKLAALSTCKRAQVGAIVVPGDLSEVYAIGYNGMPAGIDNSLCTGQEGECGCVHGEANAVCKLSWHPGPLILMTSTQPCWRCAGLIINKRLITHVIYWRSYREGRGLALLESAGIECLHYKDTGNETLKLWWPADRIDERPARPPQS